MKRLVATIAVLVAVGALVAAPVPVETRKPAAFPAGHYVLAGADEAAKGEDVFEMTKTFRLKPNQYVLSGGPKPTDLILVDDDIEVSQDKTALFIDDDHVATTSRGKQAASYQGAPIVLVLDATKKLRVRAIDHQRPEAVIGALWLHRWDRARKKLTDGKSAASGPKLPDVFFDESFAIADGFEMPEKVSTEAATDMPAKPATLLPRFKPKPTPPAPPALVFAVDPPKAPDTSEFVRTAIVNGLTEDGASPELAAQLAKREDFIGKCSICTPTQKGLLEFGQLKEAPVAKEGKGLPTELVTRLNSDTAEVRQLALRELVQRYIDREYARRDLTAEQTKELHTKLEKMRKDAAGLLKPGQKFCPSCDGACQLAPKL